MKMMQKLLSLCAVALCATSSVYPLKRGSLESVSCEAPVMFPAADNDNAVVGFAWLKNGMQLQDATTRCLFDSVYPVSGVVDLRGGVLELKQPLIVRDAVVQGLGDIIGNNNAIHMSCSPSHLPENARLFQDISLILNSDITINHAVTFKGACSFNGSGNVLHMGPLGKIIIEEHSNLDVRNMVFDGVTPDKISCASETAKFTLHNITLTQDEMASDALETAVAAEDLVTRHRGSQKCGNDGWDNWNSCCGVSKTELLRRIKKLEAFTCCLKTAIDCLNCKIESCCDGVEPTCCDELFSIVEVLESIIDVCCDKQPTCCDELFSIVEILESKIDECCDKQPTCCDELFSIVEILESKIDECCDKQPTCCDELFSIVEILESQIDVCCKKDSSCCEELRSLIESCCERQESCCQELHSIIETCCERQESCCEELRSIIETCCEQQPTCCDELRSIIEIIESRIDQCCGENCVIDVTGTLIFDPATMTPAAGQAKVFRFDSCAGRCQILPKVIFPAGTKVQLPIASRILFAGEGIIEMNDGVQFTFDGTGDFDGATDWAQIVIEEYAKMIPVAGATVVFGGAVSDTILGSHACIFTRRGGAMILDQPNTRFIFGDSEFDFLDVKFDSVGSLLVRDPLALVTFQKAATHLDFDHQSDLSIERGTVEINVSNGQFIDARDGAPAAGTLEILHFTNGSLLQVLRRGTGPSSEVGLLRLAPNFNNATIDFNGKSGQVINGGHIEFRLFDDAGVEQFNSFNQDPAGAPFESAANIKPSRLEIQNNFFVFKGREFPMVEVFMNLALINNSLNFDLRSNAISDRNILVKVGSLTPTLDGRLAALRPGPLQNGFGGRDGSIKVLDTGDHDLGYDGSTISGHSNQRNKQRLFRVDVNGVRTE